MPLPGLTAVHVTIFDIVDILIVTLVFYAILALARGTRADQILQGIIVVFLFGTLVSSFLHLRLVSWLIRNSLPAVLIAIPVIFQPELRRLLSYLGRTSKVVSRPRAVIPSRSTTKAIDEICRAATRLSERRYGGLICLERSTGLQDYVATGVRIDGMVTAELLLTIFFPNSPLHDGAVIVRGDRVVAASAMLPLSDAFSVYNDLGTRHRAALGLTEQTDAIAIVVSEETGIISLAENGRMVRNLHEDRLRRILLAMQESRRRPPVTEPRLPALKPLVSERSRQGQET
jgi:diadenylate cyclase